MHYIGHDKVSTLSQNRGSDLFIVEFTTVIAEKLLNFFASLGVKPSEKLLYESGSFLFGFQKEDLVESRVLIMDIHEIAFSLETGS